MSYAPGGRPSLRASGPAVQSAAFTWQVYDTAVSGWPRHLGRALCFLAFFRSRRPLDDPHWLLVDLSDLRCLLEFGRSCDRIEVAGLPAPQLGVEATLSQ